MKIAICGDIHFCKHSSIIHGLGSSYTDRLENCLLSVNWFEDLARQNSCDAIVYLGDFFNSAELEDEVITAVKDINWSNIPTYILVGNHESSEQDLHFSSTKLLENFSENRFVIDSPKQISLQNIDLCFLPYISEIGRQPLSAYFPSKNKKIIFSHNDIKGLQLGPVVSQFGFPLEDIANYCSLFINGHLHNGSWIIPDKVLNLGILTGKDFGENSFNYFHNVCILDLDPVNFKYAINFFENPFAYNFYKFEINSEADFSKLGSIKNQAVLSIKCNENYVDKLRHVLQDTATKIAESRIVVSKNINILENTTINVQELTMDHITKFVECCHEKIDNTEILEEELTEICK